MASREKFGGRAAVILALAGSAIGLGNIWRFPYLVGMNGGAAFIVIYIGFVLLLSIPIFLAESIIGRSSGTNCRAAIGRLVPGRAGRWFGLLMVFTPLWIVSYYSVVTFISSTWTPVLCHLVFLAITVGIVAFGVKSGIERFSKVSIPILFVLILVIAGYSVSLPGAGEGIYYLTHPDFSKVTVQTFVNALGQAFYSLSLGMGIIITYSSYVSKDENLLVSAVGTSVSDLLFAYIAGFAILPAVFAAGIAPGTGPGLVFDTLPYIFSSMAGQMPVASAIAAILFFAAILVAALTSSVSLIEVGVAYLTESKGLSRAAACLVLFFACGLVGALSSLSFGPLSGIRIFGLCVVLVGWVMPLRTLFSEFTNRGTLGKNIRLFPIFYFLIRYVAPIGILALVAASILL